jgi:hypothetical protein
MLIDDELLTLMFETNTVQRGKRDFSQGRVQEHRRALRPALVYVIGDSFIILTTRSSMQLRTKRFMSA